MKFSLAQKVSASLEKINMAKIIFAFFLILSLSGVISRKNDYSDVDLLRAELHEIKDLFKNTGRSSTGPGEGTYTRLVMAYKHFDDSLQNSPVANAKNYLDSLDSLWLWAKVQTEMKKVDGLYENFKLRLRETAAKTAPFQLDQWLIFAKTVLNDPNYALPPTLDSIANSIIQDNLFAYAYQVQFLSKNIFFHFCND